jgi:hypothetical protein
MPSISQRAPAVQLGPDDLLPQPWLLHRSLAWGFEPPTVRSVAWCSASIWTTPGGHGLLRLGASSIQEDQDRSRRIVWMINRMIKKIRRSTSRVMCLALGPRGWVQRFGSPACAVFAMGTLFTSILKPAKQVDIAYKDVRAWRSGGFSWAHERDNHLVTHSLALT